MSTSTTLERPIAKLPRYPPLLESFSTSSERLDFPTTRQRPLKSVIKLQEDVWGQLASSRVGAKELAERKRGPPPTASPLSLGKRSKSEEESNEDISHSSREFEQGEKATSEEVTNLDVDGTSPPPSPPPQVTTPAIDPQPTIPTGPRAQRNPDVLPTTSLRYSSNLTNPTTQASLLPPILPARPQSDSIQAMLIGLDKPVGILLANLEMADYKEFLSKTPIDPRLSYELPRIQLEFFCSVLDPKLWSSRPHSVTFSRAKYFESNDELLTIGLDLDSIRKKFPLQQVKYYYVIDQGLAKNYVGLRDALSWMYGSSSARGEVYHFLEHSPLPLLVLGEFQTLLHGEEPAHEIKRSSLS